MKVQLGWRIQEDVYQEFKYYCKNNGLVAGVIVEHLIKNFLVDHGVYNYKKEECNGRSYSNH